MLIIGTKVFSIVPKDDPVMIFMTTMDPDHVELTYFDTMYESHQTTTRWWGISLDAALDIYGPDHQWVNPD